MTKVPAEMMREFVRSQNFTSTDEVMTAMKNMFKDILQEVMNVSLQMSSATRKAKERRMMNAATSRKITETATQKRQSKPSSENLILKFRGTETANMNQK